MIRNALKVEIGRLGGYQCDMGDWRAGYGRKPDWLALVALAFAAGCSGQLSSSEARRKADEYVGKQFNLTDFRLVSVETNERPSSWVVTYSAKRDVLGGPLIIGVDKQTGEAHLIKGYQ